jgi:hypothetical protein
MRSIRQINIALCVRTSEIGSSYLCEQDMIYRHFDSLTLLFSAYTILSGTYGLCGVGIKESHSAKDLMQAIFLSI